VLDVGTLMPEGAATDTAKPAASRCDLRIQDICCRVSDPQIDRADDPGGDPGFPVVARCAHRGNAVHELGLPDAAKGLGSVRLEHRPAFNEYGRDDVVPARDVFEDLVEQVARLYPALAKFPEMMVRI